MAKAQRSVFLVPYRNEPLVFFGKRFACFTLMLQERNLSFRIHDPAGDILITLRC